jgi:hypothetical protein
MGSDGREGSIQRGSDVFLVIFGITRERGDSAAEPLGGRSE